MPKCQILNQIHILIQIGQGRQEQGIHYSSSKILFIFGPLTESNRERSWNYYNGNRFNEDDPFNGCPHIGITQMQWWGARAGAALFRPLGAGAGARATCFWPLEARARADREKYPWSGATKKKLGSWSRNNYAAHLEDKSTRKLYIHWLLFFR